MDKDAWNLLGKQDWNDGYWTEGLDRIHTISEMMSVLLFDGESFHPSVERAELETEVHELFDKMHDLYQKMGAAIPEDEF